MSQKDNKFAVCKVCAKVIPRGGMLQKNFNTTKLIRHLKVSYIKEYTEFSKLAAAKAEKEKERAAIQTPLTQLMVTETYNRQQLFSNNSKKKKELNKKVMELIMP